MKKLATAAAVLAFGNIERLSFRIRAGVPDVPSKKLRLTREVKRGVCLSHPLFEASRVKRDCVLHWQQRETGSNASKRLTLSVANIYIGNWQQLVTVGTLGAHHAA